MKHFSRRGAARGFAVRGEGPRDPCHRRHHPPGSLGNSEVLHPTADRRTCARGRRRSLTNGFDTCLDESLCRFASLPSSVAQSTMSSLGGHCRKHGNWTSNVHAEKYSAQITCEKLRPGPRHPSVRSPKTNLPFVLYVTPDSGLIYLATRDSRSINLKYGHAVATSIAAAIRPPRTAHLADT